MGGGYQKFFCQVIFTCRASGRVEACSRFLQEWGIDPALPHGLPHSYSCGLPSFRPQSGAHQLSATATVRSATLLFSFRSSDDQLLRLSFVDLVPRLGLNSIHSTTLRSSTARRSSLSASTGDREHATPLSRLQRHVVVVRLLTLASGARVGGWAPKSFAGPPR